MNRSDGFTGVGQVQALGGEISRIVHSVSYIRGMASFWEIVQMATFGSSWRDVQDRHTKLSIVFVIIIIIIIVIIIFLVGERPSRGIGKGEVVAHRCVWVILRGIEQFAKFIFDK
jgi:hypothetical protein